MIVEPVGYIYINLDDMVSILYTARVGAMWRRCEIGGKRGTRSHHKLESRNVRVKLNEVKKSFRCTSLLGVGICS